MRGFEIVGIVVTEAGATDWLYHHWGGRGLLILDLLIQDGYGLNLINRMSPSITPVYVPLNRRAWSLSRRAYSLKIYWPKRGRKLTWRQRRRCKKPRQNYSSCSINQNANCRPESACIKTKRA